ncbi:MULTISPECIES: GNAT family N-acetyltransferase [Streptomyces]|uniref:GNAT family N-acetyltransferase n=1 Tax=Streptomyces virginiae TaxID=1961 RepID=A0ABQ3NYS5_STRVG|nr:MULTISPECIES: GNAT family N-acetyltransferase [Streptomyces]MBP2343536.1 GNAT superfamily N-acetyltransferase [Streptomyces virginiae]MCI4080938.1 GNAT family N-acetyltransferase [Streptomyces sp. MMS21 TC-5]GGQ36226.1 GNAT family N-acetyltransferase [Streptomyces virginiae]GHI17921.1 GNAT family N-acetyltransferase [Streptomyces virginiae]GLV90460.1 GNAT family N-acetyltransferase [Streptomyces lavendulae subsp. lavendulae]
MTTTIRDRTHHDLNPCADVLAQVHEHDGYPVNWPAAPDAWLTPPALLHAWVAELHGTLTGHIGLSRSDPGDAAPSLWSARTGASPDATAVISRLFVAPSARGHRIGAALMTRATAQARTRGLHPVLDVVATDTAAAALYERLGWQLLGTVNQQWSPTQTVAVHCYAAP